MRQTAMAKSLMFPDGFRLSVSTDGTTYTDCGALDGGGTITFNWDDFYVDAGNYEGLVDKYINPTIALAPSNLMDFDPDKLSAVFQGFMSSDTATAPTAGTDLSYAGTKRYGDLTRVYLQLTHYTVDASGGLEEDTDIDWQFTLSNSKIDAGASFNLTGAESSDLSNVSVSFTSKPNPADITDFFKFFHI